MRFSQLRSVRFGVAVVLAAATPAHAITDGRADGYPNRCAMRGEKLPTKHTLGANDTGNSLSRRYYGNRGGALTILWSIGLTKWGPRRRIVEAKRYDAGDAIVIPKLPQASINPPPRTRSSTATRSRDAAADRNDRGSSGRQLNHDRSRT